MKKGSYGGIEQKTYRKQIAEQEKSLWVIKYKLQLKGIFGEKINIIQLYADSYKDTKTKF